MFIRANLKLGLDKAVLQKMGTSSSEGNSIFFATSAR